MLHKLREAQADRAREKEQESQRLKDPKGTNDAQKEISPQRQAVEPHAWHDFEQTDGKGLDCVWQAETAEQGRNSLLPR
jgi:hypothetical protein